MNAYKVIVHSSTTTIIDTVTVIAPNAKVAGRIALQEVRRSHKLAPTTCLFGSPTFVRRVS